MQEVLQRLPDDLQQFLLRTSVAQPLTVELATVLSDDHDTEAKLAQIEHTGLFVTRSDEPASEYRFHSLFGALLHARIRHLDPELERKLSGRAAFWFDKHDMPVEAEKHAFAAGEWQLGSSLACKRWVQSVLFGAVAGAEVVASARTRRAARSPSSRCSPRSTPSPPATAATRRCGAAGSTRCSPPSEVDPILRVTRLLVDVLYARCVRCRRPVDRARAERSARRELESDIRHRAVARGRAAARSGDPARDRRRRGNDARVARRAAARQSAPRGRGSWPSATR